ncbi:glycosyltransferase family A protein [Yonghaparkia sp. Soil809]|uniref:glycosyltransferase family A protein n=1 Tax=Yonghaparkia sp. Soil809 TaxID=1736417 RepID=UPI000B0DBB86|nr:glycosyltransferase family A protein [Yonghaparkia sp. Soil809]
MAESGAGDPAIDPAIDLVIAVHSPERPVERAVSSALAGPVDGPPVRVTVVCHDLDPAIVAARLGALADDARVRLLAHGDGIRSPSGPFNAGLDAATGEWVAIMGSDDELEAGALAAWHARARAMGADIVLPRIVRRDAAGRDATVATPPARPGRRTRLDGVRDRLSYRSAPLGLLRRALVGATRFGGGLSQGEDVLFSARLWFSGATIALADGPAYVVHDDARDRVTLTARPLATTLAFIDEVLDDRWFRALPEASRDALGAKLLRINVLGEFVNRPDPGQWSSGERDALARLVRSIRAAAPSAIETMSIADRRLLDALPSDSGADARRLLALARARRAYGRPATLLTRSPRRVLAREAPLRMMAASFARRSR